MQRLKEALIFNQYAKKPVKLLKTLFKHKSSEKQVILLIL